MHGWKVDARQHTHDLWAVPGEIATKKKKGGINRRGKQNSPLTAKTEKKEHFPYSKTQKNTGKQAGA